MSGRDLPAGWGQVCCRIAGVVSSGYRWLLRPGGTATAALQPDALRPFKGRVTATWDNILLGFMPDGATFEGGGPVTHMGKTVQEGPSSSENSDLTSLRRWNVGRPQWCWAHLKRDFQALIDLRTFR